MAKTKLESSKVSVNSIHASRTLIIEISLEQYLEVKNPIKKTGYHSGPAELYLS